MEVILPPATIGVLGGGQLGRMLGFAARAMGYRLVVLDPDPDCPASAVADEVVVGSYSDVGAAMRLAQRAAVVTYELEHVDAAMVDELAARLPVRPGAMPLRVTQHRVAERRFVASQAVAVAPWREVVTGEDALLSEGAAELGFPLRLKAAFGGYDGRSQVRLAAQGDLAGAWEGLGRPGGEPALLERELEFAMELSVICARSPDGWMTSFPPLANHHDRGILIESVLPAPVDPDVASRASAIAERLAVAMDLVGLLTVEMFLLSDGQVAVNELAPRVHNSGHATLEASATSQFEQHIRAVCGLPLGSPATLSPAAMVNILGAGPRRPARLRGVEAALTEPDVHLHLYDKREVFERRKMAHVTALGATVDEALARARAAAARLSWA